MNEELATMNSTDFKTNADPMEVDDDSGSKEDTIDVLDLNKLCAVLEEGKEASDKISGKDVLLLIGGTGAGKVCFTECVLFAAILTYLTFHLTNTTVLLLLCIDDDGSLPRRSEIRRNRSWRRGALRSS
jgi:ABC-type histidine transport system ATPase subunit